MEINRCQGASPDNFKVAVPFASSIFFFIIYPYFIPISMYYNGHNLLAQFFTHKVVYNHVHHLRNKYLCSISIIFLLQNNQIYLCIQLFLNIVDSKTKI